MTKRNRKALGAAATALWAIALAVTALALAGGGGASDWHLLQLPLLIAGGSCGVMAVLGTVIAPAKELWRLGYDAGLRDGARAMMTDRVVAMPLREEQDAPWS